MRKQNSHVAFFAQPFVLGDDLLSRFETDAFQIARMCAGNTCRIELDAANDAYLQTFHVESLVRYELDARRVRWEYVGAYVSEVRQPYQRF
jgi:hypothetical protein